MPLSKLLIIVLSLLTMLITAFPVVRFGSSGVFYTIDPDVQYLSNSFSYIEKGKIQYDVHPGTPTIMLHAFAMWPLRIYAKLIEHQPFMIWVFNNVENVYYYIRIYQSILLGISVGVFLWSIYTFSKSLALLTPAWLGLFTYTVFPYFGSTIVPETTSFFLVAFWLLIFSTKRKNLTLKNILFLSIISGLSIANKFSNLTLMPITVLLVRYLPKLDIRKWIRYTAISTLTMILTFFAATWPIRGSYAGLWKWVLVLASSTGTHGGGKRVIFDLSAYMASLGGLVHREWWSVLIVVVSLGSLLGMIVIKKIRIKDPICLMGFAALLASVVYAKFPLSHYQLANFTLILFVGSVIISKLSPLVAVVIFVSLVSPASANLVNYGRTSLMMMDKAATLEKYVDRHSSSRGTLWEWARNRDFSFLWGRDWAHGVFDKELSRYRPNLLAISSDMDKIKINNRELKDVFEVCWNKFYVQSVTAPVFLAKYAYRNLRYIKISGIEDIGLIESDHCEND